MSSAISPRRTALLAILVLFAAAHASAEPLDVRGLPAGAVLEAFPNSALGQTILFARFPDGRTEPAFVTIEDAEGAPRATLAGAIEAGGMMIVWDGRGDDGEPLPAGIYVAKLVAPEASLTADLALR